MKMLFLLVVGVVSCGLAKDVVTVRSPAELRAAIRAQGATGAEIELVGDDWRFTKNDLTDLKLFISNHDQSPVHKVHLPIVGCTNLLIRGRGQTLVFDRPSIGAIVKDSKNVRIENLKIDWNKPYLVEGTVVGFEAGATLLDVPGEMIPTCRAMFFDGKTHEIIPRSNDVGIPQPEKVEGNRYRVARDLRKCGTGAKVEDVLAIRPIPRLYPAIVLDHVDDTVFVDVVIHTAGGMGVIAQMCENFTWEGTKDDSDKTSGVFPPKGSGRVSTLHADATHFSNCRGTITIKNCFFETMMDDALNVHCTCLAIQEILPENRIRVKFMHGQAYGFELFHPGDVIRFIHAKTLENGAEVGLSSIERLSDHELILTLKGTVPASVVVGDAVENATYEPAVCFENNTVARNRARGILITTSRPVVIKDNLFDAVSGAAILFAGDSQGWYESGACRDVLVTKNVFRRCMTCRFQFCEAVISSYPMVKDIKRQKVPYHQNIRIVDNVFTDNYAPNLFKISTDPIIWENNK